MGKYLPWFSTFGYVVVGNVVASEKGNKYVGRKTCNIASAFSHTLQHPRNRILSKSNHVVANKFVFVRSQIELDGSDSFGLLSSPRTVLRSSRSSSKDDFSSPFEADDDSLPNLFPLPSPAHSASPSSSWGIADDWSTLSTVSSPPPSLNYHLSSSKTFDAMGEAARILEEQDQIMNEKSSEEESRREGFKDASASSVLKNYGSNRRAKMRNKKSDQNVEDEKFIENAVDIICNQLDYAELEGVQLYNTLDSTSNMLQFTSKQKSVDKNLDHRKNCDHDEEISFLIRCHQKPEQFLITQGKELPELTNDMKYSIDFLLEKQADNTDLMSSENDMVWGNLPLQPKMTYFFENAVKNIFDTYAVVVEETQPIQQHSGNNATSNDTSVRVNDKQDENSICITPVENQHSFKAKESRISLRVMDRNALSKWMSQCLAYPFDFPHMHNTQVKHRLTRVGPHDKSISVILSRYSQTHGSGRLTLDEFQGLYLECVWAGYIRDLRGKKVSLHGEKTPTIDARVILQGKKNTESILDNAFVNIAWRDMEAHGIFSPAEEERLKLLMEMENNAASNDIPRSDEQLLMDECELLEDYEERLSHRRYTDHDDFRGLGHMDRSLTKKKEKSSHELVDMTFDGVTPKRIRDGQFVFIDEESCIGCTQCAQISPSSFKMIEDSGRARTYFQRTAPDVEHAVSACPVNCMHMVSFDELKEMEVYRDSDDGKKGDRYFGFGRSHVPLHVAGRDSDANRKSSWYHFLKSKCHGSAACPQRGCYDCPKYPSGENPFFKERHKQAELARAKDFIASGEANRWRKVIEL